jgi:hypothetical protein
MAGLPATGELDEATMEKMAAPRCGDPDVRKKTRSGYVAKWEQWATLRWAYIKPTSQIDSGNVRRAIRQALDLWSEVVPLNFTEVSAQSEADLRFSFAKRQHCNSNAFDGPHGVLAHAFFPKVGELHFDDEEPWAYDDGKRIQSEWAIDLLSVVVHELGHALGLDHLPDQGAIMQAFYFHPEIDSNGKIKPFVLSQPDVQAIQKIYGPRKGATTTPRPTTPTPEATPPGGASTGAACPRFQAIVTGADNATYFFNGNSGWRKTNVLSDPPNSATRFYLDRRFNGVSGGITAGVTDRGMKKTFLFQGRRVYGFSFDERYYGRFVLDEGYPKDITNDVPFTPEIAFQSISGYIALIGNGQYVHWDPYKNSVLVKGPIDTQYPYMQPNTTPFNVPDNTKLYMADATNYYVYTYLEVSVTSNAPLKTLITC